MCALNGIIIIIERLRFVFGDCRLDIKALSLFNAQIIILLKATSSFSSLVSRIAVFIGLVLLST